MSTADESFFSTLAKIETIEKGDDGQNIVHQNVSKETLFGQCARLAMWVDDGNDCKGEYINSVCNVAVEDLPRLRQGGCVIGNKFKLSVDAAAVACQMMDIFNASGAVLT